MRPVDFRKSPLIKGHDGYTCTRPIGQLIAREKCSINIIVDNVDNDNDGIWGNVEGVAKTIKHVNHRFVFAVGEGFTAHARGNILLFI